MSAGLCDQDFRAFEDVVSLGIPGPGGMNGALGLDAIVVHKF